MVASLCAAGGGAIDMDTPAWRRRGRRRCTRRAARWRCATRCCRALRRYGFSAHRPPGHHAEPGQAMGFCFFDSVAVGGRVGAGDGHGLAGADPRLGRPPRQRDQRDLPVILRRAVRVDPPGAAVPGDGAGVGRRVAVRGRATRSTCPCRRGRGTRATRRWSRTWSCRWRGPSRPISCWCRPASTPTCCDPLASCRVTESGFAAMTASLRDVCLELGVPLGFVLEGGY